MYFYNQKIEDVYKELQADGNGLSAIEVETRLKKHGFNELQAKKKVNPFFLFLMQFKNVVIYILFGAAILSFFMNHMIDAFVILGILIINATVGFIQEYKAEQSIEALKKLASLQAKVLRDGKVQIIMVSHVLPGDIILLETGDKVPADARLIEVVNLETQEASLTGESLPVHKNLALCEDDSGLGDQCNMVFSGTIVTKGRGKAIVTATGMQTQIGRIAELISEEETPSTPLQENINRFGKILGITTIILCVLIFAIGFYTSGEFLNMLMTAIALGVAAVPEGLPIVVTISLAFGTQRLLKKNALMRKLASVETLGSTTVICTDKTGTLTKNEMTVKRLYCNGKIVEVTGDGYESAGEFISENKKVPSEEIRLLLTTGILNNDSHLEMKDGIVTVIGDPTEGCLLVAARKLGLQQQSLVHEYKRVAEIGFDSTRKMMTTIHHVGKKKIAFVKGASDILLELCTHIKKNDLIKPLKASEKQKIIEANKLFAKDAMRVLAFAYKELDAKDEITENDTETSLTFLGLQAMIDPPREEVKDAIARCNSAGIRVIMITGDDEITAKAIAKQVGIESDSISGKKLSVQNIPELLNNISIFARVNPEHKLQIVEALKKKGEVVAVTGDGVNDAPALKKADIGIAMGITGTDVSKEASSMVLVDDNFTTIVNAVEEGRNIYNNIRRFISYQLSTNIGAIILIVVSIIFLLPLPILPLQLLWVNLSVDGPPALSLGIEPGNPNIMQQKPRKKTENIISLNRASYMFFSGIIMTLGTLALFLYILVKNNWSFFASVERTDPVYMYAVTVAFTTFVMFQMFNVINWKAYEERLFTTKLFQNKWLWLAIALSISLQLLLLYTPLSKAFGVVPLSIKDWVMIIVVSSSVLWFGEIVKIVKKYLNNNNNSQVE
ncbi:calcium-translocating P-type ATPase, SERCA-type [Candidatus Woesearchaeota archaeon]|nr:calcium-translocating P-type ATPase, SERCA-type [Candidatus Woesearchaeota archaeon]